MRSQKLWHKILTFADADANANANADANANAKADAGGCTKVFLNVVQASRKGCANGPVSAILQSTLKMGQSVTIKPKSLLDVLYLGRILDTFGHFIGIN